MEIWKEIVGYEGFYEVSNYGKIRSLERKIEQKDANGNIYLRTMKGRVLSSNKNNGNGYKVVALCKGHGERQINNYIHILVAKAFVSNPENKLTVNHIDGNKSNNYFYNLEWATSLEQASHAQKNNLRNNKNPNYSDEIIMLVYENLVYKNKTYDYLRVKYGISKAYLYTLKIKKYRSNATDRVDEKYDNTILHS